MAQRLLPISPLDTSKILLGLLHRVGIADKSSEDSALMQAYLVPATRRISFPYQFPGVIRMPNLVVELITRRSQVRILSPPPIKKGRCESASLF